MPGPGMSFRETVPEMESNERVSKRRGGAVPLEFAGAGVIGWLVDFSKATRVEDLGSKRLSLVANWESRWFVGATGVLGLGCMVHGAGHTSGIFAKSILRRPGTTTCRTWPALAPWGTVTSTASMWPGAEEEKHAGFEQISHQFEQVSIGSGRESRGSRCAP